MSDHPSYLAGDAANAITVRAETRWRSALLGAAGVVAFTLLTAASSRLRFPLPFSPVPVTMQTWAVLLAGAVLGPAGGAGSQALYLLAGAAGVPWFTTGSVLGPTAGYLLGFLPAAALVGFSQRRWGWTGMIAGMLAGSAVIYALGAAGLCVMTGADLRHALAVGVVPFLPGDALKLIAAAAAARLVTPLWLRLLRGR